MTAAPMTAAPPAPALLTLLQIEREARHAQSAEGLGLVMANRTRMLIPCRSTAVLSWSADADPAVAALSDVPAHDPNAGLTRWLAACARSLAAHDEARRVHAVDPARLPPELRAEWAEWSPASVLWVPLLTPDGQPVGALWMARDEAWSEPEAVLAERLADTYGHAWGALLGRRRPLPDWMRSRRVWLGAAVAVAVLALVPVRQSALAPAQIVAADPFVVAAPLDGVVARFHVRPNEAVAEGRALLDFDDTALRARQQVAAEELAVAGAELRKAEQGALSSPEAAAQVALARAQVDLKAAELAYASEQLERGKVKAERAGIAVFRSVNDWIGRPVRTGERILTIADPARVEIEAHLPAADAIVLEAGNPVAVFLDARPLEPVAATLADASYEAAPTEEGILAYRVRATLDGGAGNGGDAPRIGLRGTARIDGPRVPLFLYLFRRPIAALRHMLGL
mgnify:CR=1 FL=1